MKQKLKSRIIQTFTDCVTVFFVATIFLLIFLLIHPFSRGFYCNDDSIRYPYQPDTIPLYVAGLYGALGAFFIIFLSELYLNRPCCIDERKFRTKRSRCHTGIINAILIYSMGAMATLLITEVGKRTIGRLRPHFFDVCKPKWDKINCYDVKMDVNGNKLMIPNYIPFDINLCSGDEKIIHEARLSFPSGHSSFTVYSMMFIIVYLEARVKSMRVRFIKAALQLFAFIAAWHTCMSRVSDHKHHYTDVIAGATIGFLVAIFVTRIMGTILWVYGFNDNDDENDSDDENYKHKQTAKNQLAAIDEAFKADKPLETQDI